MKTRNLIAMGTATIAGIAAMATLPRTKKATLLRNAEYEVDMLVILARDVCQLHRGSTSATPEDGQAYLIARYAALAMHERHTRLIEEGASHHTILRLAEAIADLNEVQGFPRHVTDQNRISIPCRPTTSG